MLYVVDKLGKSKDLKIELKNGFFNVIGEGIDFSYKINPKLNETKNMELASKKFIKEFGKILAKEEKIA